MSRLLETFCSSLEPIYEEPKDTFTISNEIKLKRFLFLGSENGTMSIKPKDLTHSHIQCINILLQQEQFTTILDIIHEYTTKTFKKDCLLCILAICCSLKINGDVTFNEDAVRRQGTKSKDLLIKEFKNHCFEIVLDICKTPTQLFLFIDFYQKFNQRVFGSKAWNKTMKNYISQWYLTKSPSDLLYLITKYQNRNNWTHKDVIRLCHVKTNDFYLNQIFRFIIKGLEPNISYSEHFNYIFAIKSLATETNINKVIELIKLHNLVREQIPTKWLNYNSVWSVLIVRMPDIALLKNLNKITSVGCLDNPFNLEMILNKINNIKVHPLQILITIKQYSTGSGDKGNLHWTPNQHIIDALNELFYKSFDNIQKTGKKILLALDISGSMTWTNVCGIDCLTASEVACAMALIFDKVENASTLTSVKGANNVPLTDGKVDIFGFSKDFIPLPVSSSKRLDDNLLITKNKTFGPTDISVPFEWAMTNNKEYDCIIVFTDSETNCNKIPPSVALENYNKALGLDTKLIVCALAANDISIADTNNPNMLDICGFDTSTHEVINEFILNF
jgi:60 kDa SS-A/Ro ribonucleoprotein